MIGPISRRGCAVLLAVLVTSLVGVAGGPAGADPEVVPLPDAVLYYTAADTVSRIGGPRTEIETFEATEAKKVALDDNGTAYVLSGSVVRELKPDGQWGDPLFPGTANISDVAAGDGRVVVTDPTAGSLTVEAAGGSPTVTLVPGLHPSQVAVTAAALYFIDESGSLYRHRTEDVTEQVALEAPVAALAADSAGKLYLGHSTTIVKYDPVANETVDVVTSLSEAPIDVAVGENGDVYYATSSGDVVRVPSAGGPSELIASAVQGLTAIAVRTVPEAPAAVAAEGGVGEATVFWRPSRTNGGPSEIRYRVATYVNDVRVDAAGCATSETSCTVENLQDGTTYRFGVTAFNTADGNDTGGSVAGWSEGVEPGVRPSAPTLGTPVPGNGAASVVFSPGGDNGVAAAGWQTSTDRLVWRAAEVLPAAGGDLEVVVPSLVNDQANTLYVRAYDAQTGVTGEVGSATVTPSSSLPGTPKVVEVRPGENSATLIFEPAEQDGGEISGYEARIDGGPWNPVDVIDGVPGDNSPPADQTTTPVPTETASPAEPTETATPVGPTETATPVEPTETATPAEPTETPTPVEPTDTATPVEPTETATPAEPTDTATPVEPTDTATPVEPTETATPAEPTDTATPVEPTETASPAEPNDTPTPVEPSASDDGSGGESGGQIEGDGDAPGPVMSVVLDGLTEPVTVIRLRARNDQGAGVFAAAVVGPTGVIAPDMPPASGTPTTTPATEPPVTETTEPGSPSAEPPIASTTTPPTTEPTTPAAEEPTAPAATTPVAEEPTTPAATTPVAEEPTTPAATTPATEQPTTPATTAAPPSEPATTTPAPPTTTAPATTAPASVPAVPTTPAAVIPLAPVNVTASAGLASITVSWDAPSGNGARITGYRATVSPGGASCTSSGRSCVVGGDAGTSYTASVVALSAAGASPASAPSNAVTPTELSVPSAAPVTNLPLETPDGPVSSAVPGGKLRMSGSGYAPFSVVTLAVYSEPLVLGTVTADAQGAFETEIDVPGNLSLGKHSFVAAGVDKNGKFRALRLDLTVAEADDGDDDKSLPVTGAAVLWMLVAGFASVVSGVAVRRLVS